MQYRQSCPVRDKIMRRYDQKLLGAPLWCTTQQEEGLWIQGVNAMVPLKRVFVCASELALDENLSHQHKGTVYHRGRSLSASTSMIRAAGELDYFSAHIRLREPGKSKDKVDAVYLSIDQGELLGGHNGVEAGGRKGRGSDDESRGAQLPKSKASVSKEVDSEEHHSAAEADLLIAKEGMQMQVNR
ncbi:hypothetical protein B296_00014360 [Ensete ventricosum]|uniref:Uncharacterized protein n=1 Tax=Ensete ventricosum TaxID=4639 RepID=A0A426Z730_ENSVE|nr:hypothetical protein B296_00014360 [Ensete ventricosum]